MDDANGATRKIVAKYENKDQGAGDAGSVGAGSGGEGSGDAGLDDSDDGDALVEEKKWMNMMVGARHMIQRQFIPNFDEDDSNRRMYLMEFMKHGTIDKLLRKLSMSEDKIHLRSSDLWRVLLCLFRACVAMAYPNRWVVSLDAVKAGAIVQLREELVPIDDNGIHIPPGDDVLVNTDINYNNIMIGDYDTDAEVFAHTQVPVFKVGDLGIVDQYKDSEEYKFASAVYNRITGNQGTHTPEQFTQAWGLFTDWETMMAQDDTAGRYGWATNLYQIGVIMNSLITQNAYDRPPSGTIETISGLLDNDFDVFTYGGHVLDQAYDHYDRGLRMAITWIMAHTPGRRPTMMQLQDALITGVNKFIDEEGRVSIGELVGSPPPP
ncbi:hypothetical protein F5883DRAFT_653369 [Diaporthe sp. PMI_573]|nr:hypothetical protein F5883DRAFT_653369 [Diaporthaceae sp. PMI_573]